MMVSLVVVVSAGMLMSAEAVGKPMFTYLLTYTHTHTHTNPMDIDMSTA